MAISVTSISFRPRAKLTSTLGDPRSSRSNIYGARTGYCRTTAENSTTSSNSSSWNCGRNRENVRAASRVEALGSPPGSVPISSRRPATISASALEIHPRSPGIARNVVERRAGHVRHLANTRMREQRLARVVAVLVAYEAQLHDRELRGGGPPQDAVVEDRERRGGHALLRGLDISRRNKGAYDRRHTGLRGGGDQADEHVLEFIGGPGQSVQSLPDRPRAALQQSARLDRPAAVDADPDVSDPRRNRPHPTLSQHLEGLENGQLPGIAGPRNECALGLPLSEIYVLQRVAEQHEVPDDIG